MALSSLKCSPRPGNVSKSNGTINAWNAEEGSGGKEEPKQGKKKRQIITTHFLVHTAELGRAGFGPSDWSCDQWLAHSTQPNLGRRLRLIADGVPPPFGIAESAQRRGLGHNDLFNQKVLADLEGAERDGR